MIATSKMVGMTLFNARARIMGVSVSIGGLTNVNVSPGRLTNLLRSRGRVVGAKRVATNRRRLHIITGNVCAAISSVQGRIVAAQTKRMGLKSVTIVRGKCVSPPNAVVHIGNGHTVNVNMSASPRQSIMLAKRVMSGGLTRLLPLVPMKLGLRDLCLRGIVTGRTGGKFVVGLVRSVLVIVIVVVLIVKVHTKMLVNASLIFSVKNALLVVSFVKMKLGQASLTKFVVTVNVLMSGTVIIASGTRVTVTHNMSHQGTLVSKTAKPR